MAPTLNDLASFDFVGDGGEIFAGLIFDSAGDLYGASEYSAGNSQSSDGYGAIFEIKYNNGSYGSNVITLANFDQQEGEDPASTLLMNGAGDLFGTTVFGGNSGYGTVFQLSFDNGYSAAPNVLASFNLENGDPGDVPTAGLIEDADGNLYGTAEFGGDGASTSDVKAGVVFEIPKIGGAYQSIRTLVDFATSGDNSRDPDTTLTMDSSGNLFGETRGGGLPDAYGSVFEVKKVDGGYDSTATTLVDFDGTNGKLPSGGLIEDAAGDLFGEANGGANDAGVVFEIAKHNGVYDSTPTDLVTFGDGSNNLTNESVNNGGLIMDAAGNLFGTSVGGGDYGYGAVFEVVKQGPTYLSEPKLLASFDGDNGNGPRASLVADSDGNLFGTTERGGAEGPNSEGTAFEITDSGFVTHAACYCPGTRIATPRGEVVVEQLRIGDLVITAAGVHRPIKWIGRRSYDGRFIAGNRMALPVCFRSNALGNGSPRRDLWVSPGHAMLVEDHLIHARLLVNGVSVTQATAVKSVTYINLELDNHDVILAEGASAESFYDNGMRNVFANAAEFYRLYPNDPGPGLPCLPLLEQGSVLERIRQRVDTRAGIVRPVPCEQGPLRGYLDVAGPDKVCGWAQDEGAPEEPVRLDVLVDGRRVMRILANLDRADLHAAGLGSGRHAFEVALPEGCRGIVQVWRTSDGEPLPLTGLAREALALAG